MIRAGLVNAGLFLGCVVGVLALFLFGGWLLILAGAVYVTLGLVGLAIWLGLAVGDILNPVSARGAEGAGARGFSFPASTPTPKD